MGPVETLVAAVTSNDVGAAAECLKHHPGLRARLDEPLPGLPFDSTVLLAAVWRRSKPMIELLLAHGADPSVKGDDGTTAADSARAFGKERVAERLDAAARAR